MSMQTYPYRRVLVMGATQTGKTTLLSKAICGEFDEYYTPTHHAQTFYDCKRRLELIDTPGVADGVLTPDFSAFVQDVLVSKMLSNQLTTATAVDKAELEEKKADLSVTDREIAEEEKRRIEEKNRANPMAAADGVEINTKLTDIYVIVYTPEPRSKYIARSLKRAIRENPQATLKGNPIFFVLNECHHERPPHPQPKEVKKWEEVALRTAKDKSGGGGMSGGGGGASAMGSEDRLKIDEWKALYGAPNVRIMTRIFSGDDGMDTRTDAESANSSGDPNDIKEFKFGVRADTGAGLHQLFDQLANCSLPAPPKRYAMGSGETTQKPPKRDACSVDQCIIM